jgi:DNA-binding beta-propeller fold protein YncE
VDGTGSAARFYYPSGIAVDNTGNLYVADAGGNTIRQVRPVLIGELLDTNWVVIGTNWVVSTLAGVAGTQGSTDGIGTNALFHFPWSANLAIDTAGALYVADGYNHIIRVLPEISGDFSLDNLR